MKARNMAVSGKNPCHARMSDNQEAAQPRLPQKLFTKVDVASLLDIGLSTVDVLIRDRGLPTIRWGETVRIRPESLDVWLAEQEQAEL